MPTATTENYEIPLKSTMAQDNDGNFPDSIPQNIAIFDSINDGIKKS